MECPPRSGVDPGGREDEMSRTDSKRRWKGWWPSRSVPDMTPSPAPPPASRPLPVGASTFVLVLGLLLVPGFGTPAEADGRSERSRLDTRLRWATSVDLHGRAATDREVARRLARTSSAAGVGLDSGRGLPPRVELLLDYAGTEEELEAIGARVRGRVGSIWAVSAPVAEVLGLAALPEVVAVEAAGTLGALSEGPDTVRRRVGARSRSDPRAGVASPRATGAGVVVAVIDTGVDVFHHDFRNGDGTTRIRWLLDLSLPGDVDGDGELDGPAPWGGTVFDDADIDAAIVAGTFASTDPTGHGTHVLSVAAGDDPTTPGLAPDAELIVVKATRTGDSLGFVGSDVVAALDFVETKADELGLPWVVNLSLGTIFASHDGRSLEEQAIDALVGPGRSGRAAVVAAGNSGANGTTAYRHARGIALPGLSVERTVVVPAAPPLPGEGNDRVLLDLWWDGRDELEIELEGPASCGGPVVAAAYGTWTEATTGCGDVLLVNLGVVPSNGANEALVLVDDTSGLGPESGDWTLRVRGEVVRADGAFDVWAIDGFTVGGASPFFADGDHERLVGKPGTSWRAITVGAQALDDAGSRFRTSWTDAGGTPRIDDTAVDGEISGFSSPGGTRDGRVKPEVIAPGERVLGAVSREALPDASPVSIYRFHGFCSARGAPGCESALIVDATPDASFGLLEGTSFAAPVVTGQVARLLELQPTADAEQLRNQLIHAASSGGVVGEVPNPEWGYGKTDLDLAGDPPGTLPSTMRILDDTLPGGVLGEEYVHVLRQSGGTPPVTWQLVAGSLPTGVALLAPASISGTPTAAGDFPVTFEATDSSIPAQSVTRDLVLSVAAEAPLRIATGLLPSARLGRAYSASVRATGGTPPYSFARVAGALPNGITLTDPELSGEPTEAGDYSFTIEVTDDLGSMARGAVVLPVMDPTQRDWEALGRFGQQFDQIAFVPGEPDRLFANAVGLGRIYESTDGGDSWSCLSCSEAAAYDGGTNLVDLAVDSGGSAWGIRNGRIPARWDVASGRWQQRPVCAGASERILDIAVDANDRVLVLMQGLTCASNPTLDGDFGSLYVSDDDGASWTRIGGPGAGAIPCNTTGCFPIGRVAPAPSDPSRVYVGYGSEAAITGTGAVYFASVDGGATWSPIPGHDEESVWQIDVSAQNAAHLLRIGGDNVNLMILERSVDAGASWTELPLPAPHRACSVARSPVDPDRLVVFTRFGALLGSDDGGDSWVDQAPGPVSACTTGISGGGLRTGAFAPADAAVALAPGPAGLYRTDDAGATWVERIGSGLYVPPHSGLAVHPTVPGEIMVTSVLEGGVHVSRSGGDRWVRVESTGQALQWPEMSPADSDLLYVYGGRATGTTTDFLRSETHGATWTDLEANLGGKFVAALAPDPADADVLYAHLYSKPASFQYETEGVWRSEDRGETWAFRGSPVALGTSILFFSEGMGTHQQLEFTGNGDLLLSSWGLGGAFLSGDGGASWSQIGSGGDWLRVASSPADPSTYYAVLRDPSGNIFVRFLDPVDGTGDWQAPTTFLIAPWTILASPEDRSTAWVAITFTPFGLTPGVWETTDAGRNWVHLPGLETFNVVDLDLDSEGRLLATTESAGIWTREDGAWLQLRDYGTVADIVNVQARHPTDPLQLFAGTEGLGVQLSLDGGATFSARVDGLGDLFVNALEFDPDDLDVLWAGTDQGLFVSEDGGTTWTATTVAGEVTAIATENDGVARMIWVTVRNEGVAHSEDGGDTFETSTAGLASLDLTDVEVDSDGVARMIWVTTFGGDGVAVSGDDGVTFASASGNGLTNRDVHDLAVGVARMIWVTTENGVFVTDDDGANWRPIVEGLPGAAATSVELDPTTGEAFVSVLDGDVGGVYRGGGSDGRWIPFDSGLDDRRVRRVTQATTEGEMQLFAATSGTGIFATTRPVIGTAPPTLATPSPLPAASLGDHYGLQLEAAGGTPPYRFTIVGGELPPGIDLGLGGRFSGEPALVGTWEFDVAVAGADDRVATARRVLVVGDFGIFADGFGLGDLSRWSASTGSRRSGPAGAGRSAGPR